MQATTCCFIGHRTINESQELRLQLHSCIEHLITDQHVDTFLFGSKSQFNSLCYCLVTELKETYPHIKRIYVRAEFPDITEHYQDYLQKRYEETYYPHSVNGSGKAAYIQRNRDMIKNSFFCIFYYTPNCLPQTRKSGTALALDYAQKKNLHLIVFP